MKTLLFSLILASFPTFAGYGKPQLLARYSGVDSFNAPHGLYCFSSEPEASSDGVFLGCRDEGGALMMKWSPDYAIAARSENGNFSHPKEVSGKVSWYEFSAAGVQKIFEEFNGLQKIIDLKNVGPLFAVVDSFTPTMNGTYVYRLQDDAEKNLNLWQDHSVSSLFLGSPAFIFPPTSSHQGELISKIRKKSIDESSPDELVSWNGSFKTILKDRDSDPTSSIKSFRHQYAIDHGSVALVVTDSLSETMILIENGKTTIVARVGRDLLSFDYFSPKMRNGILLFRGVDLKKRKTLFLYEKGSLKALLTQGDVVQTDKGPAVVDYKNQDAIFYGAPGIGPNGEIYQQATLTDIDSSVTLLGIGLIIFKKE